jgi:hypothetical protein
MKAREAINSNALHEAGHAAACINLGVDFGEVYLEPARDHPGLVPALVRKVIDDYRGGVLTPEQESHSTNLAIIAFAGPVCDALHEGRSSFEIIDYPDLDEVLDMIESRFSNNTVRVTFTRYCEAEAFALFEDDRRLWRYTNLLARELAKQKKLTYAQCLDLYTREYFVESWVRKEVEEIRRAGGEAPSVEQRVAKIESERQGLKEEVEEPKPAGEAEPRRKGRRRRGGRRRGRGRQEKAESEALQPMPGESISRPDVPVQDQQQPKQQETPEQPRPLPQQKAGKKPVQPPLPAPVAKKEAEGAPRQSLKVERAGVPPAGGQPAQQVPEKQIEGPGEPLKQQEEVIQSAEEPRPAARRSRGRGAKARPKDQGTEGAAPVQQVTQKPERTKDKAQEKKAAGRQGEARAVGVHPDSIWQEDKGPGGAKKPLQKAKPRPAKPAPAAPIATQEQQESPKGEGKASQESGKGPAKKRPAARRGRGGKKE